MFKLFSKLLLFSLTAFATLLIFLYFDYSINFQVNDNKITWLSIVPDSYSCPQGCNTCNFGLLKIGIFYLKTPISASCTLLGCSLDKYTEEHQLCSKNWIKSTRLSYKKLPGFVNYCINDYRNITYVQQLNKRRDIEINLADSQTRKHTKIALHQGIKGCNKIYNLLRQNANFNETKLLKLGIYMNWRDKINSNNRLTNYLNSQDIIELKEIFDYLKVNQHQSQEIISNDIIEQFQQEYELVLNSPDEVMKLPDNF
ncbi:MAG: hypothetical protein AAGE84_24870 [Cyanobacteria bacterium P01_G01_bin.39]